MASDDIGGVWRTVGGRHIFIKDGKDLASAMKKSGKFKSAKKKKNDTEIESSPRDAIKYHLEKGEFEQAEKYMKEYGLEDERELFAEGLNYRAQSDYNNYLKSNVNKEKSTRNKTKMQEIAVKGAPEKDLKEQYKQSLNEVSKMEYDGKINKDEYEKAVKNINDNYINKRNEYNGTDTKNGGSKNEFTREELKAKYGTDNTDIINAGKEKDDRISLKSEKSTNDIMNEKIRSKKSTSGINKSDDIISKQTKVNLKTADIMVRGDERSIEFAKDGLARAKRDGASVENISDRTKELHKLELKLQETEAYRNRIYKRAYQEYLKEHPNSKIKFNDFLKNVK